MGRDKFLKLLRSKGLMQKKKKYKKPKTDSNHPFRKYKNRLTGLEVKKVDEDWVSDITYIRVGSDWNYLTLVLDLQTPDYVYNNGRCSDEKNINCN